MAGEAPPPAEPRRPAYADAVAELVARVLKGAATTGPERVLDAYRIRKGGRSHRGAEISRQVKDIVRQWRPRGLVDAVAAPPGEPADVRLVYDDGHIEWIQVKAQLVKRLFSEITQADWEQDVTTSVAMLAKIDPVFAAYLTPSLHRKLGRLTVPAGWSLGDLVAADLAGLPTYERAQRAGVRTVPDLHRFLPNSYLLHLTYEGSRLLRLADFTATRAYLNGAALSHSIEPGSSSLVKVKAAWGQPPGRGTSQVTYYVYDRLYDAGVVFGRHKVNFVALGDGDLARSLARP